MEDNKRINIFVPEDTKKSEILIREVGSANELPVKEPIRLEVAGVIGAPVEFLRHRYAVTGQIDREHSHVIVDRDHNTITLITNEDDERRRQKITGKIALSKQYEEFGINTGKSWNPNDLGQFFKMNRIYFPDREKNMQLVTLLKSFEADIQTKVERERKENGSFKDNYAGVVTANIPPCFDLAIPIYKGSAPEIVEVEFYATVNGRDVFLSLYSPGAVAAVEDVRNNLIDDQIKIIREEFPELPVIEI